MKTIIDEVEKAMSHGLYYLAVSACLTLPDICAALESLDGETTQGKYETWCKTWFLKNYAALTPYHLYKLRCGVVHQGRFKHEKMQHDRVIFGLPSNAVLHGFSQKTGTGEFVLHLNAEQFCRDMLDSVRAWFDAKKNDKTVQENLPNLLRLRPSGISPYLSGIPVIA